MEICMFNLLASWNRVPTGSGLWKPKQTLLKRRICGALQQSVSSLQWLPALMLLRVTFLAKPGLRNRIRHQGKGCFWNLCRIWKPKSSPWTCRGLSILTKVRDQTNFRTLSQCDKMRPYCKREWQIEQTRVRLPRHPWFVYYSVTG